MKWKSILKVLILFLLGMALGAFIMGWFVNRRLHAIQQHQVGKGFSETILRFTNAEGKEREQLFNLSSEYGENLDSLRKNFEQNKVEMLNEFEGEAIQFLSGPTRERLEEHLGRLKRGPRHHRPDHDKKKKRN